ncbi:MAG: hypothetical protein KC589_04185 [Nanoarchaeota archaeon]|nr:hypothetical protein [Nanoarchaeota archaeon]MCA9496116.1 hypothetical protein [Nanoarchaeota archaeon]
MTENNSIKRPILIKDEKLKPLLPTLRQKKRFIKIKIESTKQFDFKTLSEKLSEEIIWYMGLIDFGIAGVWFLKDKFNLEKQELIIKVGTKHKEKLLASLYLIEKIDNTNIKIHTIKTSGTLKGLEKEK